MLKSKDIKESVFATSMSGYRKDEVDTLLDQIVEDYSEYETTVASQQSRIAELERELAEKDVSMNSINTVLLSAQKLADDIIEDAKKQAEETVDAANAEAENIKLRTKKALEEIDAVLTEQKNKAQAEVDMMLKEAARKSEGMILAAKDSVTREQLLFDKLKSEVAEFKVQIKESYKEHLESLSKLPEEVVLSPELAASTIEDIINKEPDLLRFIEKTEVEPEAQLQEIEDTQAEEFAEPTKEVEVEEAIKEDIIIADEMAEDLAEETQTEEPTVGFVIQTIDDDEKDDDDDSPNFSKGFFAKNKNF